MPDKKLDREDCLTLLKDKYSQLQEAGLERYPQRSDFSELEVVAIKAFFGPWPRALEAAGIKEQRDGEQIRKNTEKRIRAKRRRIEALKAREREKKNQNAE